MSPISIRIAQVPERESLEALQRRASLNNPNDREALLQHPDAIVLPDEQIADGGVFVAEEAGQLLGFAAILPRDDGNSELDALFVEPACWRRGIGRVLVEHCAQAAKRTGAIALHVVGNPHARNFYAACGFELIGETRTRFGVGLLMRKMLG